MIHNITYKHQYVWRETSIQPATQLTIILHIHRGRFMICHTINHHPTCMDVEAGHYIQTACSLHYWDGSQKGDGCLDHTTRIQGYPRMGSHHILHICHHNRPTNNPTTMQVGERERERGELG